MRLLASSLLLVTLPAVTWAQVAVETYKLLAADGSNGDAFGWSVATSGVKSVIGAPYDGPSGSASGSAYVFETPVGVPAQVTKLVPTDGAGSDQFGISVGISGNVAIVGAWQNDDDGTDSGSAYLFNATTGQQLAKLLPSDGAAGNAFGWSVAISGNRAIVGARSHDGNGGNAGAAYLFDATTGIELARLLASDGAGGDSFGHSVAISGNIAIVGALLDDGVGSNSGSAYLFDATTGLQLAKLVANDQAAEDRFGSSVAVSGELAIVGSHLDDDNAGNSGSVYAFDTASGAQLMKLVPDDGASQDQFGYSVALSGRTAIVGAWQNDDLGSSSGAAYAFDLNSGQQLYKYLPSDGATGDRFGQSVAIRNLTAIIGSPQDDENGTQAGSAYRFNAGPDTGKAYCFGDGSGTPCPCNANGGSGEGCLNTTGISGALLEGMGFASIGNDTFKLSVSRAPGTKPGLILRGNSQLAGGLGTPVGDGLLCTSGQTARSHAQITSSTGTTTFTDFDGMTFADASYGPGGTTNYQFWYRDPSNTCSGSAFNFSNAWTVTWLP